MIKIANSITDASDIMEQYPVDSIEREIIRILSSSSKIYDYSSIKQLEFELKLRNNIVISARDLYRSGLAFRIFRNSICNPAYWDRTDEGGFLLKEGVKPSSAVRDIYTNGRKYGTECATAIVIVFYKAVVEAFPEESFDEKFKNIYLMDWQREWHLRIRSYSNLQDYLPGDCRYFKNPDVDPLTPEWQGENAIDLTRGLYYGHGIGIRTAEGIIDALNKHREQDSQTSAYLMDSATRPDFKYLEALNH